MRDRKEFEESGVLCRHCEVPSLKNGISSAYRKCNRTSRFEKDKGTPT